MKGRGVLIAIEGIDGAGKTTQAVALAEALSGLGHKVIRSKEPTDGQWGQKLRASGKTGRLDVVEELALFLKDRREHVKNLIAPNLKKGNVVIVDRYYFSMAAYQGARGEDPFELLTRNEVFAPRPDLLLFLDVTPKVGLSRVNKRPDGANHFEKTDTLQAAAEIFRSFNFPYLLKLDGELDPGVITRMTLDTLYAGPLCATGSPLWPAAGVLPHSTSDVWNRVAAIDPQKMKH